MPISQPYTTPNAPNQDTTHFMAFTQQQITADLTHFLASQDLPNNLKNAVTYATLNGGKRIRPALVFAAFISCQTSPSKNITQNTLSDTARRAALAVELLHCYSLVHDDLPCIDNDELRRGKPTCHIAHGEAVALLAGDVLQSLAFECLVADVPAFAANSLVSELLAIFAPRARRMVAGQIRDLNAENKPQNTLTQAELERIHTDKTGALIEAATLMGGVCAGASTQQLNQLQDFAKKLGLAFQVQDDILDITASTTELGKPAGSDEKLNKATYPKLMGLTAATDYASSLFLEAKAALHTEKFTDDNLLLTLADRLWGRKF